MTTPRFHVTACLALLLFGCGDDASNDGDTDAADGSADETGESADTEAAAELTFWDDVAPMYFDSCVSCHREGGIAPFALDNYADASAWATASLEAIEERTMPPWLVTEDGSCGEFRDSRGLSDEEIAMVRAWVDAGMAEGPPRQDLELPPPAALEGSVTVETPNFQPEIVGGPLAEFDEYRCFAVDPQLDADAFLTAYNVRPGNEAIVHHVLAFTVDPDAEAEDETQTNAEAMAQSDAESPDRAGWPCFEGAGERVDESSLPIAWAPGQGIVRYPEGTGLQVGADEVLVLQVHYNLADPATIGSTDQTLVDLQFADQVERPGFMDLPDFFIETLFDEEPAFLPPGDPDASFEWDLPLGSVATAYGFEGVEVWGVLPHMHERGTTINMHVGDGESETCAVDVQNWDFAWQHLYFYEEPLLIGPNDSIRVRCGYDTSGDSDPIFPGWGTKNEMCLMGLFMVPR